MHEPDASDPKVVTVLDDTENLGYRNLQQSCNKHGIALDSLISPLNLGHDIGLGPKLTLMQAYVARRCDPDQIVLFVDAFDVLFATSTDDITRRYHQMADRTGKPIVMSAETMCSPHRERAADYPPVDTPYRYLNSGTYVGRAGALRELLPSSIEHSINDQAWFTDAYLSGDSPIHLDVNAEIFQCLTGVDAADLTYVDGRWTNRLTGTTPCIFHGNGAGRDMFVQTITPTLLP
jgi:hypothetical protein